jgi:hypothetical protein
MAHGDQFYLTIDSISITYSDSGFPLTESKAWALPFLPPRVAPWHIRLPLETSITCQVTCVQRVSSPCPEPLGESP